MNLFIGSFLHKDAVTWAAHTMSKFTTCVYSFAYVVCACVVNNTQQLHTESTTLGVKDKDSGPAGPDSHETVVGAKSCLYIGMARGNSHVIRAQNITTLAEKT